MPVTDPIADMLTRVRNAISAHHDTVGIPTSNTKVALAKILKQEGFIEDYTVARGSGPQGELKVALHYRDAGESAIVGIKRVSKPGLRVYVGKGEIPRFYGGLGVAILSTSKGVMTGKQAWSEGVGGEVLCHVW
jgi:small subunit ribosomal protein S8